MAKIKTLFEKDKSIYRPIEKVVTFGNSSEDNLKHEISEYIVTDNLRYNFENILDSLDSGMNDGSNEIGIWVSGFYGSGKSSFSKYLGFGLQKDFMIDGQSFTDRLTNRINYAPIKQLFKTIIEKHDPAIILLDCATEQIMGGTLPPVLELLIAKVNHLAGYSSDSQLANLESMLQKDGNLDQFVNTIKSEYDKDWDDIKINDQLRAKGIASKLAAKLYPEIWKDDRAFKSTRVDDMRTDRQKVEDLLSTVTQIMGRENIIFIVDEVGQYISAKNSLILSMQGTLEILKDIGKGKIWLLATAQQTLTEDNPNARLNSEKLYKLNARFPVKVDIKASDIKEICTKRLLGKSTAATNELKKLYNNHGERLKHFSKLENCERTMYVKDSLDEKLFVDLYPFLPQHFEIIISLLGRLAKVTGGVGLRSAIKVIQDILKENLASESTPLAEQNTGKLACTYHIYDVLKADIRKSYSHVVATVDKIRDVFGDESNQANVAKSIGVLQLLDDFFLSEKNVAALMHPNIESTSITDEIKSTVEELKNMPGCTLNEIDGELRFMTEAITNIENEKNSISATSSDTRKVYEDIIKDIFSPVPQARLQNTKTVRTGINLNLDMRVFKLIEPREEIQTEITFINASDYKKSIEEFRKISTESSNQSRIYLVGKIDENIDDDIIEIVKCEGIFNTRQRYDDKEINDYLNSQDQQALILKDKVRRILLNSFEKGEFIFRGSPKPTKSYGSKLREALAGQLKEVSELVFNKYKQAAIIVGGVDAERLLQFPDLRQLPPALNHFDIVKSDGSIDLKHLAINLIQEYIQHECQAEGKKLLEYFDAAPYGWNKDTTRYLVSLMFLASDIKIRISGEDIKVKGPKAIEALKNVNGFNKIGLSMHDVGDKPTMEMLSLSVKRLTELTGENVAPLQDKIAEVVRKHFPVFQTKYSSIKTELEDLGLPGIDRAQSVKDGLEEVLKGEGSDAAFRLGKEDSDLYNDLKWIQSVHKTMESEVKGNFKQAIDLKKDISELPDSGIPKELKDNTKNNFSKIEEIMQDESFTDRIADLKDAISNIEGLVSDYCQKLLNEENEKIQNQITAVKSDSNWSILNKDQQTELNNILDALIIQDKQGIKGIKEILNANYAISSTMQEVKDQIAEYLKDEPGDGIKKVNMSGLPRRIEKIDDIDEIIHKLEELKELLKNNEIIELNW